MQIYSAIFSRSSPEDSSNSFIASKAAIDRFRFAIFAFFFFIPPPSSKYALAAIAKLTTLSTFFSLIPIVCFAFFAPARIFATSLQCYANAWAFSASFLSFSLSSRMFTTWRKKTRARDSKSTRYEHCDNDSCT
jgi:hypothetical protein